MRLSDVVNQKWNDKWHEEAEAAFKEILSGGGVGRYPASAASAVQIRSPKLAEDGAPFAALIHPNNQSSGGYAGMSFVVFPSPDAPTALIAMVVGTLGLGDDAPTLGRPGHARRLAALTRWLNSEFGGGRQFAWSKTDPAAIDVDLPEDLRKQLPSFQSALRKYGKVIYAFAVPPHGEPAALRAALFGFLDLAMEERGILPLTAHLRERDAIQAAYLGKTMPDIAVADIAALLARRRYAIVEGPPGTGKTRLALEVRRLVYGGRGTTVQFHPGTTYENFIGGLAPVTGDDQLGLRFEPRAGFLMNAIDAAQACYPEPYLLHLDEVNRADLAKVLGEAIYLLEPSDAARTVQLPYEFHRRMGDSSATLAVPENLHILGTMNSADRSIAILDVAIRRRFAFVRLWPQRTVVEELSCATMLEAFDRLSGIFLDWATDEAFALLPGHSYFLDPSPEAAPATLKQNLVPLLEEYLAQGYLPGFAESVRTYIQWVESL